MRIQTTTRALRNGEVIQLRSPKSDEAMALLSYIRELSRDAWRNLNHPPAFFEAMTKEDERDFIDSCAAHPKNFLVAAFVDSRIIGTASIAIESASFSAHCATLGLGVSGAYRGQGVGRILMETLIENALAAGVWNLQLHVRTFNTPAIALYESMGFRLVGTLRAVAQLPDECADEHVYQYDARPGARS